MKQSALNLAEWLPRWFGDEEDVLTSEQDREFLLDFAERMAAWFKQSGRPPTLPDALRVADLATWVLAARRIQRELLAAGIVDGKSGGESAGSGAKSAAWKTHPALEALAKNWERIRKAMKELHDTAGPAAAAGSPGLADLMKPILKQADGVLEDALAYKKKKKERQERRKASEAAKQDTPE